MKRRVLGEGRMAYVLVVVGASMAAAGLFVIGYGWFDARFEEYWSALAAGATLTAGGIVTLALGFAVRALLQVKAALVAQAVHAPSPSATHVSPDVISPDVIEPTLGSAPMGAAVDPVSAATVGPTVATAPPTLDVARRPHPPRPQPAAEAPAAAVPAPHPAPSVDLPESDAASRDQSMPLFDERHPATQPAPSDHGPALHDETIEAKPADDYKLEMPSTAEHDLPEIEPDAHDAAHDRRHDMQQGMATPSTPPTADDWFDRALADIDEELPLHAAPPAVQPPADPAPAEPAPEPRQPELEAAMAAAEAPHPGAPQENAHVETPVAPPPTSPSTVSAVIGRYEADGTSYVMYADGSIEAQSSAGVYRFGSMAELKAFIET